MKGEALPLAKRESAPAATKAVMPGTPRETGARRGPRLGQRRTLRRTRTDRNRSGSPARARLSLVDTVVDTVQRESKIKRQEVQKGLGIRVTVMRKARGWPQDVLARKWGISPSTLGQIERGYQDFRLLSLLSIARGLETTVADLLMGIA